VKVILLERMGASGAIGDEVEVKNGYARNFLLPKGKAVRATAENRVHFESRRVEILKADADRLVAARARGEELSDVEITISGRTTEEGRLYGSIGAREISAELARIGHEVERQEVDMPEGNIREPGEFHVRVVLHPEVSADIRVVVIAEQA